MSVDYFLHPSTSSNLRFVFLPFRPRGDKDAQPAFSVEIPPARSDNVLPGEASKEKLENAIHDYCGSMCPVYEDPHLSHLEIESKWMNKENDNGTFTNLCCLKAKVFVSPYWKVIVSGDGRPSAALIRMHGGEIPLRGSSSRYKDEDRAIQGHTSTYYPDDVVLTGTTWSDTGMSYAFKYIKGSYKAAKKRKRGQAAAKKKRWLKCPVLPHRDITDLSRAILTQAGLDNAYWVCCPRERQSGLRCLRNILAFGELLIKGFSKKKKRELASRVRISLGEKGLYIIEHQASKKLTSTTKNKYEREMISICRRILRLAGR